MARKAVHLRVHGRVQGVGFRYFTLREADALKIHGWVRNCPDGTVEIEAEGPEPVLKSFIDIVRAGPSYSRVSRLDTRWLPAPQNHEGFHIRH